MGSEMKESSISLSERESEVLKFLTQGLSNKEIAERLRLSPLTVKRHVENIFKKCQVKNRVEAALFAIKNAIGTP